MRIPPFHRFFYPQARWQLRRLLGCGCLSCNAPCSEPVCATCLSRLKKPHSCEVCGIALKGDVPRCHDCLAKPPAFSQLDYIAPYAGQWATWIVEAKIARQPSAMDAIRCVVTQTLAHSPDAARYQGYTLLPMPIPKLRLMQRGFNLPEWVAQCFVRQWQLPCLPNTAVKTPCHVRKQAHLTRQQRLKKQLSIK